MKIDLPNLRATKELAQCFAKQLTQGDTCLLYGDYGVGKTAFARFLIQEWLGVDDSYDIPSPSFAIVQEYENNGAMLRHVDLYRLTQSYDVVELGFPEFFEEGISLIEWPQIIEDMLPARYLKLNISEGDNGARQIEIETYGDWDWIDSLKD